MEVKGSIKCRQLWRLIYFRNSEIIGANQGLRLLFASHGKEEDGIDCRWGSAEEGYADSPEWPLLTALNLQSSGDE